jgi:hypothetical protein
MRLSEQENARVVRHLFAIGKVLSAPLDSGESKGALA